MSAQAQAGSPALGPDGAFEASHYASGAAQKIRRSLQLGPGYYLRDLPRYYRDRKALGLPPRDFAALINPLREFGIGPGPAFRPPPFYPEALSRLSRAGVRLSMPRPRAAALAGAWWSARGARGDVIECGAYRGATSLLLAVLGDLGGVRRDVIALDTFADYPETTRYDYQRSAGEFGLPGDQVALIRAQAESLGVGGRVVVLAGPFSETFRGLEGRTFAFSHIDANIFSGTLEACRFVMPRGAPGGIVAFDDYNGPCDLGARLAVDLALAGGPAPAALSGSSAYIRLPDGPEVRRGPA